MLFALEVRSSSGVLSPCAVLIVDFLFAGFVVPEDLPVVRMADLPEASGRAALPLVWFENAGNALLLPEGLLVDDRFFFLGFL
jgi:hypothetical protein